MYRYWFSNCIFEKKNQLTTKFKPMRLRMVLSAFLISVFLLQSCSQMNKKMLVIGHRGAMGHETENTIKSIEKALELGVDMIEIDVFKIKSGEIVVFHDVNVERLTDGTGKIEDYTWAELQNLTLTGNHKIPLLTDVMDVIDAQVGLNVELKGAQTAKDVNRIILDYIENKGWKLSDFMISSFNWDELAIARNINKEINIGVLTGEAPEKAIPVAHKLKAIAINPDFGKLTPDSVLQIKDAGLLIYPWTVNEEQDIIKMKRMGVDAIFTNFPERVF